MADPSVWVNRNDVATAVSNAILNHTNVLDAVNNCCPTRGIAIDPGPPVTATITVHVDGKPVSITLPL